MKRTVVMKLTMTFETEHDHEECAFQIADNLAALNAETAENAEFPLVDDAKIEQVKIELEDLT